MPDRSLDPCSSPLAPGCSAPVEVVDDFVALGEGDPRWPKQLHRDQLAAAEQLSVPLAIEHRESGVLLALIPGGEYLPRRDDDTESSRVPAIEVPPFYLGMSPLLQSEWELLTGSRPSHFRDPDRPLEMISWNQCHEAVSNASGGLRLPSEAEWEVAARAGTDTAFWWGPEYELGRANCNESPLGGIYPEQTTTPGRFPSNPYGLLDMFGNVWEWCEDRSSDALSLSPARVVRGGSWFNYPAVLGGAARSCDPDCTFGFLGCRVARGLLAE